MTITLTSIALGGALGAVLRYLVGLAVAFPLGTLTVNVVGSFLIGAMWVWVQQRGAALGPFLMIGLLGGFTTFSTFSLDTIRLVEDGRMGAAGGYVLASVVLALVACWAGLMMGRAVL